MPHIPKGDLGWGDIPSGPQPGFDFGAPFKRIPENVRVGVHPIPAQDLANARLVPENVRIGVHPLPPQKHIVVSE